MAVKYFYHSIFLFFFFQFIAISAQANLMIAPQRVVFDERTRSASVNLINTSNATNTYRLRWIQKKQTVNGRYIDLPDDSEEVPSAASMLRFSPRQVTLAPGEKQTVRIALRRSKNMNKGEYRSHLLFQALPKADEIDPGSKGARIKINLLLGFAIPVIVRQGKLDASASVQQVQITRSIEKGEAYYGAKITLRRSGPHTIYGTLKVFWKSRLNRSYKQVAILNNVALYPENSSIQYYAGLKEFVPSNGYLKVSYEGRNEFDGKMFDVMETRINTQDILLEQPN